MVERILQNSENNQTFLFRLAKKGEGEGENSALQALKIPDKSKPAIINDVSSNLLARNFVSTKDEVSRYTKAALVGIKATQQMGRQQQNTLTAILETARVECENAGSLGETYKAIKRAEKSFAEHQADEVRKTAEKTHLKETKEYIEEKTQETTMSDEVVGNSVSLSDKRTIDKDALENAVSCPVSEQDVQSMPEISTPSIPLTPATPKITSINIVV